MENWQIKAITENLPELIKTINANVLLVCQLQKDGILSDGDIGELDAISIKLKKAKYLLDILTGRKEAFKYLARALLKENQSGAFNILLQAAWKHAIFGDVLFEGFKLTLETVCKSIGIERLQAIIKSELNAETGEKFLDGKPWPLARETIPGALPYYIPRRLSISKEINMEIFSKLENDIFCIEGVGFYQLSRLASRTRKQDPAEVTIRPDFSRNQIHSVTTRFILLERHDHFREIVEKAKTPVHWLKYSAEKYCYLKSNPRSEAKNVSKFLVSKGVENLSEEEFIERCASVKENEPVFISDSPGMGKSVLLANLARKVKESRPQDSVIYFEIADRIQKLRQVNENCNCFAIKQTLVNHIAENELGRRIMGNLLDSKYHKVKLFLDGYDQVLQNDCSNGRKILDNLVNEGNNFQVFIATRPHKRNELEKIFGVLGYKIRPFNRSNKLEFFMKYWESKHGVRVTDQTKKFAQKCLKTVAVEVSGGEIDIAGIPLHCKMLAEIYAKDAKTGDLNSAKSELQLSSIFQMFKLFIDTKLAIFFTDDVQRQTCYDFHVREALYTLFPKKCKKAQEELCLPDDEPIYRIGVLEPLKSDSSKLAFSHMMLAECFVAEFLVTSATSKLSVDSKFINLVFKHALMLSFDRQRKQIHFQNRVLCHFINLFLSPLHSKEQIVGAVKIALRKSSSYNSRTLINLLESCLRINAMHLYLFLLDVYLDLVKSVDKIQTLLRFHKNLQDTQNWKVEDAKKLELVNDLKNNKKIQKLVYIAVKHSSLNLVKLSCQLLESLTGNRIHEISYDKEKSPMYIALKRGHYHIFEFLLGFDKDAFYKHPLLHWCLENSYSSNNVADKVEIVKMILDEKPDLLNTPHPPDCNYVPLVANRVHVSLVKILIEAGAELTQTNRNKGNIAHRTAEYFSAEEYHELVQLIISRNAAEMVFKQRDEWGWGCRPVHRALMNIELKTETLELLANNLTITWMSELGIAEGKRSDRVTSDIKRLIGGEFIYTPMKGYHFVKRYTSQNKN